MSHILISEDELHTGTSLVFSSHGVDGAGSNTVTLLNSVLVKMFHMSLPRFLPAHAGKDSETLASVKTTNK